MAADLALIVFEVTYALLSLSTSVTLTTYASGAAWAEWAAAVASGAALLEVGRTLYMRCRRWPPDHRLSALASAVLASLLLLTSICLLADSQGGCVLNGGHLQCSKWQLGKSQGLAPAPWGLCITLDLAIASGLANILLLSGSAVLALQALLAEQGSASPPAVGTPIGPPPILALVVVPGDEDTPARHADVKVAVGLPAGEAAGFVASAALAPAAAVAAGWAVAADGGAVEAAAAAEAAAATAAADEEAPL